MKKMTWAETVKAMRDFNETNNITNKGIGPDLKAVVVFTQDSFTKPYSEKERSYEFNNHNKAFISGMISNSIFADCLDGQDIGVRLDWYMAGDDEHKWVPEYCYLVEEVENA